MITLPDGSLMLANGTVIPVEKRQPCEVFSRIVGYLRPVTQWNKGKKAEFADRVAFVAPKIESPEPSEERDA